MKLEMEKSEVEQTLAEVKMSSTVSPFIKPLRTSLPTFPKTPLNFELKHTLNQMSSF
jgi:hypothetical protein